MRRPEDSIRIRRWAYRIQNSSFREQYFHDRHRISSVVACGKGEAALFPHNNIMAMISRKSPLSHGAFLRPGKGMFRTTPAFHARSGQGGRIRIHAHKQGGIEKPRNQRHQCVLNYVLKHSLLA
jgi:hypothetical protein